MLFMDFDYRHRYKSIFECLESNLDSQWVMKSADLSVVMNVEVPLCVIPELTADWEPLRPLQFGTVDWECLDPSRKYDTQRPYLACGVLEIYSQSIRSLLELREHLSRSSGEVMNCSMMEPLKQHSGRKRSVAAANHLIYYRQFDLVSLWKEELDWRRDTTAP